MAFLRSSPASTPDHDLATPEEVAARRRRKRWGFLLALGVVLLAAVWLGGKPAYRAVRGWQARRIAGEARRAIDAERWDEAMGKVKDALSLSRMDPAVMSTTATFLTRTGHGREALGFWEQVEKARPLTVAEQRDRIADLLNADELDAAETRLRAVWPEGQEGTPPDWRLGLQLALRRQRSGPAITLATKLIHSPASTEAQRLDAAQVLVAAADPAVQKIGWDTVLAAAQGQSPVSLNALLLLARQDSALLEASHQDHRAPALPLPVEELATRIENHPLAKAAQQLLAQSLRITAQPDHRAKLVDAAVRKFQQGNDETLAALTAWLYAQQEYERVLSILPLERAVASRALYLQYLDTLGALGRWPQIKDTIEGQKFTLDPVVEKMYLARCLQQMGQEKGSQLQWNAAVQAAGTNVDRLLTVGHYAQRSGALAAAEAAYRAAVQAAPDSRPAQEALLGLQEEQGHTAAAVETLRGMAKVWPTDIATRNDLAYLSLLLDQNVKENRDVARELMRVDPNSVPHRVALALAELKLDHPLTALAAFDKIPPSLLATQPRYLAVYVAVLRATPGYEAEARSARAALDPARLLPEERALLKE